MQPQISDSDYFLRPYGGTRPPAPSWFQAALAQAPERGSFLSGETRIELLTWGARGRPGLLFLHGNRAHADWWSFIAPFFAADWRCAALSFSGMGGSDRRPEGYTVFDFAQEARDAVAAAGLADDGQPPIAIGHSLGGGIGIEAASTPGVFRGLVTIDSTVRSDPGRLRQAISRAPKPRTEHRPFPSLEAGLARFRMSPPQPCINDYLGDHVARLSLVEREDGWVWRFDPRGVSFGRNTGGKGDGGMRVEAVTCPLAFLHGDRSAMVPDDDVDRIRDVLPAGTPVIAIPDAAHHVPLDQPLALVAALRALLTSWPAAQARGTTPAVPDRA